MSKSPNYRNKTRKNVVIALEAIAENLYTDVTSNLQGLIQYCKNKLTD